MRGGGHSPELVLLRVGVMIRVGGVLRQRPELLDFFVGDVEGAVGVVGRCFGLVGRWWMF